MKLISISQSNSKPVQKHFLNLITRQTEIGINNNNNQKAPKTWDIAGCQSNHMHLLLFLKWLGVIMCNKLLYDWMKLVGIVGFAC